MTDTERLQLTHRIENNLYMVNENESEEEISKEVFDSVIKKIMTNPKMVL